MSPDPGPVFIENMAQKQFALESLNRAVSIEQLAQCFGDLNPLLMQMIR